jgi:hypothetical protein
MATYLSLGWEPYIYNQEMQERWDRVLQQIRR